VAWAHPHGSEPSRRQKPTGPAHQDTPIANRSHPSRYRTWPGLLLVGVTDDRKVEGIRDRAAFAGLDDVVVFVFVFDEQVHVTAAETPPPLVPQVPYPSLDHSN
jgi:hypothetical protein